MCLNFCDELFGVGDMLARRELLKVSTPNRNGLAAASKRPVGTSLVKQAVLVVGVLALGYPILLQCHLRLVGLEVSHAKIRADVRVIYSLSNGLLIRRNCRRPLALVFLLVTLKPVRLRDSRVALGGLRECRTQRQIGSACAKRRADKARNNIAP